MLEALGGEQRGLGVFEAADVAVGAIVQPERGAGFQQDDGIVAGDFAVGVGSEVTPVVFRPVGPVGGAIDGAAVEQEGFIRVLAREALFLFDLEAVDPPLHVAAAFEVELVPARAEHGVDLRGGLGDEDEAVGMLIREGAGDDRLS